jgi:hypothetical protein
LRTASPLRFGGQEVLAIAEHEHVADIVAAAMARYLLKEDRRGPKKIRGMICEDMRAALNRGNNKLRW